MKKEKFDWISWTCSISLAIIITYISHNISIGIIIYLLALITSMIAQKWYK